MTKFDQRQQNVEEQYNAEQIINNIVIVGRFLDFAQVEGLIPQLPGLPEFENVEAAFKTTFAGSSGDNLAEAVSFAGGILSGVLAGWKLWRGGASVTLSTSSKEGVLWTIHDLEPPSPSRPLPFRKLLPEAAPVIVMKLKASGYWKAFCESTIFWESSPVESFDAEVIWLYSLRKLWRELRHQDILLGIAEIDYLKTILTKTMERETHLGIPDSPLGLPVKSGSISFYDPLAKFSPVPEPERLRLFVYMEGDHAQRVQFGRMEHDVSRLVIAGVVIDLIRLAATASNDVKFLDGVINLLTSSKG